MTTRFLAALAGFVLAWMTIACGGDDDEPSRSDGDPTAVPSSVAALACPLVRDACALAAFLQTRLASGDLESVATANRIESFTCPGTPAQGIGGPFPLCDGAFGGEKRLGVQMNRRYSEGFVVSPEEYQRILRQLLQAADANASDAYGTGALRLYSLSCLDQAAAPVSCPRFAVIFSSILRPTAIPRVGIVPGREILAFMAETPNGVGNAAIFSTWTGIIQPGEGDIMLRGGGTLSDLGRVVPYSGK